jgi:uncharacterized membrane protein
MSKLTNILEYEFTRHLFLSVIVYFIISIVVFIFTLSFLSLMLAWNIILAFIPVALSIIFYQNIKIEKYSTQNKIFFIFLFLSWIAFFPNSYYVITDFIHLGSESFYYRDNIYVPLTYVENFEGYLTLIHIFLGALISVVMASYSLKIMHQFVKERFSNLIGSAFVVGIIMLSSIGIYIGRFIRLQSWNIINPIYVVGELFQSLNVFAFEFIFIFILIQLAIYYFLRPILNIKDFKN